MAEDALAELFNFWAATGQAPLAAVPGVAQGVCLPPPSMFSVWAA